MREPCLTVDVAAVLQRLDGDHELLAEIFAIYLDTSPRLLERLQVAISDGVASPVLRLVHEIKGAAANIGAEGLRRAALACEQSAQQGDGDAVLSYFQQMGQEHAAVCRELHSYLDRLAH